MHQQRDNSEIPCARQILHILYVVGTSICYEKLRTCSGYIFKYLHRKLFNHVHKDFRKKIKICFVTIALKLATLTVLNIVKNQI